MNQGKCSARFWRIIHRQVEYKERAWAATWGIGEQPRCGDGKWWMTVGMAMDVLGPKFGDKFYFPPTTCHFRNRTILPLLEENAGVDGSDSAGREDFACDVPPDKVSFAGSKWWRPLRFTLMRWPALSFSVRHMACWRTLMQAKKMDVDSVMKRSRMVQKNAWSQESRDTLQGLQVLQHHQPCSFRGATLWSAAFLGW